MTPEATGGVESAGACPFGPRPGRTTDAAPYVRYACTDELHEMQFPTTDSPLELSFILITQVKELLFRMLYVELDTARDHIRADDVTEVRRDLGRANRVQRVLLTSWDTLNGMSASDFVNFREILGEASGRQSFMYRALEFAMGNKDPESLDHLLEYGSLHRILEHEVAAASLYDEVIAYLHRHVRPMPAALLERDLSRQHVPNSEVEAAWLTVYRSPAEHAMAYELAEALIEVSFQFAQWRATHLLVVERMLGSKSGTGRTEGVEWLRHINDHRFFPELWTIRTEI